jgi:translation initiation factor IF-1
MKGKKGDRIIVEPKNVQQSPREGVIQEVLQEEPPRFRVRWDDGHESILAPNAGSARIEPKRARSKSRT